ncbi:MAG: 50S ribosomal protein L15 [Candidatus Binataceae bacterium]|nr:50S ribosomal protein L15 [Candidatus Binataceae bacterium]
MKLKDLKPAAGSTHRKKRIGRGIGSGHGKTAGRGHKGRGSRSGGNTPARYEGGQMPLSRRIPKRGFRRLQKSETAREQFAAVNLGRLGTFGAGAMIDPAVLADRGIVRAGKKIKVLGGGDFNLKMTVRAHAFSDSARAKIAAAGGVAELIEG